MAHKSVMQHSFSQVPSVQIPRSAFNRSHCHKTTFNAGDLIPFFIDEVLPGDTFALSTSIFARLSTPLLPIMDNIFLDTFYFFVPNRLVWSNWEAFCGANNEGHGIQTNAYLIPVIDSSGDLGHFHTGSIYDYMGIPVVNDSIPGSSPNALPFRAYNLIYNDWFRDENLQDPVRVPLDDGSDPAHYYEILKRNKQHDYFTSCLPWPQKGPAIPLPLGTSVPVIGDGYSLGLATSQPGEGGWVTNPMVYGVAGLGSASITTDLNIGDTTDDYVNQPSPPSGVGITGDPNHSHLFADLTNATAATINSLRQAFQLQKMFEKDARGGTRYVELLKQHYNVTSPDFRLQRPEFLGSGTARINIHPVQKTAMGIDDPVPQGHLSAFGVCTDRNGFRKSFVEHGYVIGIVNVRCDITYQQGLNRMWSRRHRAEFYWPSLAHIGEQGILNQELYWESPSVETNQNDAIFGFQERYAEYRYCPSRISGELRSTATSLTPLDSWHVAQYYANLPLLNGAWMQDNSAQLLDRCLAIHHNVEPQIIFDSFMDLKCARPMPVYSVPGLIDHF